LKKSRLQKVFKLALFSIETDSRQNMSSLTVSKTTPMMAQWHDCKEKAKDAVLLFRLGDFYEAFYEDALLLSKELELTLTKRGDVPMSGIPFHSGEGYIDRLVEKGYKVAIAEQMEDPKLTKGLVKRELVRIITPGTLIQSSLLKEKCHNFIGSIQLLNSTYGLSLLDLSTGDFRAMQIEDFSCVVDELYRLKPKELLIAAKCLDLHKDIFEEYAKSTSSLCAKREEWLFEHRCCYETLIRHFHIHSLDGFGLKGLPAAINTAGVLLNYVSEDLSLPIDHIEGIRTEIIGAFLSIDRTTQKHLEIIEPLHENAPSLLTHLDHTVTPMGGRLLREWLLHPLLNIEQIQERQEAIEEWSKAGEDTQQRLRGHLQEIRDLERLIMKISSGLGGPRDVLSLRQSLQPLPQIKNLLLTFSCAFLRTQKDQLDDLSDLVHHIDHVLHSEPPFRLSDGNVIKKGVHPELDALRDLQSSGNVWIANYQTTLREKTGIRTLKVGYTNAFGYYIEVSRGFAEKMPSEFTRRQTLVNAERFLSPELKEYEQKIFSAEEKIQALEVELFTKLKERCSSHAKQIRAIAKAIARLDVLFSLGIVARTYRYVRPLVDDSDQITIQEGRHAVIETCLPLGDFVPNDLKLDQQQRLLLLTGPNMAGKSTFIRQTALIILLAQVGSFVPAKAAHIGVVDKIFSRIGASDDLSRGQSTFMVEMSETASILHNVTNRSLVILDEIGRGTSTYDGIAIAWAVAEYLLAMPDKRAKTLFATHYWELHQLEEKIAGAVNFKVCVAETAEGIAFLHKIIRGEADRSYGIQVAKLAGLPQIAIRKAEEILAQFEKELPCKPSRPLRQKQLDLFTSSSDHPAMEEAILAELRKCDIDTLTPLDALKKLATWKKQLG
jgi:DNA mismatch repair protein MutS